MEVGKGLLPARRPLRDKRRFAFGYLRVCRCRGPLFLNVGPMRGATMLYGRLSLAARTLVQRRPHFSPAVNMRGATESPPVQMLPRIMIEDDDLAGHRRGVNKLARLAMERMRDFQVHPYRGLAGKDDGFTFAR